MESFYPDNRSRLSEADIRFVARTLGSSPKEKDAIVSLLLDTGARDQILDQEELYHTLINSPQCLQVSLNFYLYILVRNILRQTGLDDTGLADYVSGVLAHFARRRRRVNQESSRESFFYAVDMLEEIARSSSIRRFYLFIRLGEQSLVLTGLFPDYVKYRQNRRAAPGLRYYEAIGSAQYQAASQHPLARKYQIDRLFAGLSESFHTIRNALNQMQERLFFWEQQPLPPAD